MKIIRCFALFLASGIPVPAMADTLMEQARVTTTELVQALGAALKKELAAGGPENAISVCRELAPGLAGELSRRTGGPVRRVSLRTRNPLLGEPDAWEQDQLRDFEVRLSNGENAGEIEIAQTVTEPAGRYFRYMKALPVQPLCLTCHGSEQKISESIRARLSQDYPHDRAVGYSAGQLRGAVSIKWRVE